jgi:phosphatidylglycerol lysyltransferase
MQARDLVMRHGWNATAYQILNPGIEHWFDTTESAVVGYVRRHNFLLVAGSPVCAPEDLKRIAMEFEAFAYTRRCRVVYVCAEERLIEPGRAVVAVGEQPVWDPCHWDAILKARPSLRAQLRRASHKGVGIEEADPHVAAADPEIAGVLRAWLTTRRLPPLHFMTESDVLRGEVRDRLVFVARRNNSIVAYLVASPIAARNGYLIEEITRAPHAPNGTSELLIDAAMRAFALRDSSYVTMGLVALAHDCFRDNPRWLRTLMYIARAHANRFYNFRGLESFRAKMKPDRWEKIWFVSNETRFSIAALYAIGGAFSGISPLRAIAIAILKGAAQETRNFARRNRQA